MPMPKSLRLGTELEKEIDRYCAETGATASAVIRESVAEYIARRRRKRPAPTAWEVGKDLFGADRSPLPERDASSRVKELIGARLRAKHHR
jgi:Arc/MetJ-type ribon-helix-helix transcriptional regulator